jgi:hypothetical protein
MDDLFTQIENVIGTVPPGMEFIVYIFMLFFMLTVFHSMLSMVVFLMKWVGGVK